MWWMWIPAGIALVWLVVAVMLVMRARYRNWHLFGFIMLFAGVISMAVAVYFGTFRTQRLWQEAATIEALPGGSAAATLDTLQTGTEVLVSGQLSDNANADLSAFGLTDHAFVVYDEFRWDSEDADWRHHRTYLPPGLNLRLDGGTAVLLPPDRPRQLTGQPTLSREQRDNRPRVRLTGFSNGDTITVKGILQTDRRILVDRLHGGDRPSLTQTVRDEAQGGTIGGSLMALVAAAFGTLGVLSLVER